jgi:ABC-type Fe3+/spermidine/putrescine transport system ATPase subunit
VPEVELIGVAKRYGEIAAVNDLSFSVDRGSCVALLGPSGCGKTTTLRMIAGFDAPDAGRITLAGRDVGGTRPYERNVGLVFQDYALFPHMTVARNIAYGMRHRGVARAEIPRRVEKLLGQVKLPGYGVRYPSQISGGEQQRVALARALATEPDVLLLDEPLSNLDAKLRQELRRELKALLDEVGTTTIIVTHDQEEAIALASRIVVMNRGRAEQIGTPKEIYGQPRTRFVAEFMGRSNWLTGVIDGGAVDGTALFRGDRGEGIPVANATMGKRRVELGIRPERISIESLDAAEALPAEVVGSDYLGPEIHVHVRLDTGTLLLAVAKNTGQSQLATGARVGVVIPRNGCIILET